MTESELICSRDRGRINRRLVHARSKIREVRLEKPEDNTMILGAITGGIAGGLLGFLGTTVEQPQTRGYATYYGVPIGAVIGGMAGRHIHRHGTVVYRP